MFRSFCRCLFGRISQQPQPAAASASTEDAWATLLLVNDWIKHAEAKLGVIFALVGVLAAGLTALVTDVDEPNGTLLTLALISALLIVASAICVMIGLLPRFRRQKEPRDLNPLYFGDVAGHFAQDERRFTQRFEALLEDHDALRLHIARQVWMNSTVAARKHMWANRAILIGALAVLFALATGVVAIQPA